MATITFEYNARNVQAKNLLNYVLASGLFVPKIEKNSGLAKAFEDLEKGRVYHAITKTKRNDAKEGEKQFAKTSCYVLFSNELKWSAKH